MPISGQSVKLARIIRATGGNHGHIKEQYGRKFGLPADQIRFFGKLTPTQVEEVRQHFTAGLVNVSNYIYAVKRDGSLVVNREKRDQLLEMRGEFDDAENERRHKAGLFRINIVEE